jgi:hypothetical protein
VTVQVLIWHHLTYATTYLILSHTSTRNLSAKAK